MNIYATPLSGECQLGRVVGSTSMLKRPPMLAGCLDVIDSMSRKAVSE